MMVEPLRKRTMGLGRLQLRALEICKQVRKQLRHKPFEKGMNDAEFIEQILLPFETDIRQDRQVLKMNRKRKDGVE